MGKKITETVHSFRDVVNYKSPTDYPPSELECLPYSTFQFHLTSSNICMTDVWAAILFKTMYESLLHVGFDNMMGNG